MKYEIIEPCCAERQLTGLLRDKKGQNVSFITSGDVTLTHFTKAISGLPGGANQEITICMPSIPRQVLSQLGYKIKMGWARCLRLVTDEPLTAADLQSLAGRSGLSVEELLAGNNPRVILAADSTLAFSFLGYRGEKGSVYLCGHLLTAVDNKTHLYVARFTLGGEQSADFVQRLIDSRIKLHGYDPQTVQAMATAPEAEGATESQSSNAD